MDPQTGTDEWVEIDNLNQNRVFTFMAQVS